MDQHDAQGRRHRTTGARLRSECHAQKLNAMFNPKRLSLARKRRRLSSKGFAELIGMSPVTVTRLEKANNEPESGTVDLIAEKLALPRAFFFGDDIDDLAKDAASFRSLT